MRGMISGHYPYGKGFPIISVQTRLGHLDFSLYGGQILSWSPAGDKSVIFLGEKAKFKKGQAIRGGIPICWPWFGKGADGKQVPSHGVARISEWTLEPFEEHEDGSATLVTFGQSAKKSWGEHAAGRGAAYVLYGE